MKNWRKTILKFLNPPALLALCFLGYIFWTAGAVMPSLLVLLGNSLEEKPDLGSFIRSIDERYEDMLSLEQETPAAINKGSYIDLNGLMANILDQPEMNDRLLLTNGLLGGTGGAEPLVEEIAYSAENITRLAQKQVEAGRTFLFVMTPCKVSNHENTMPTGYWDTTNESADILLGHLRENGVACLDLRDTMAAEGIAWEDAFYITDHHWNEQTGFWAYQKLLEQLSAMGAIGAVDPAYASEDAFDFTVYPRTNLGSDGKRTGIYFAGVDDSTFIAPKFDHTISVELPQHGIFHEGLYEDVAYYPGYNEDFNDPDFFNYSHYGVYGWGNNPITHWRNINAPESKKCMLIGDSFGNIPFSLMSLYFESCDELDMRFYEDDFQQHFETYAPDILVLMFNPDHTTFENADYPYFPE